MLDYTANLNIEDVHISEKDKNGLDYLKKKTDLYIAQLVREDINIKKCRDLYDGRRDPREYEYLQTIYGLETPMSLKMTPLIKTRIDVLVGLLLDETFKYQVSINDKDTIGVIENKKFEARYNAIFDQFKRQSLEHEKQSKNKLKLTSDLVSEKILKSVIDRVNKTFISEFEKVAQDLITFFERDKTIELKQKLKQLFLDLLITGKCVYRTRIRVIGEDPILEVCKPENVFFNKNTNFQFMSSGNKPNVNAVVHRHYMTRGQVLTEFGHIMTEDDINRLFGKNFNEGTGSHIITSPTQMEYMYSKQNNAVVANQHTYNMWDTVTVYHTEWLANNEVEFKDDTERKDHQSVQRSKKSKIFEELTGTGEPNKKYYRLNRYETIRIDFNIYLNCGKSMHEPRSIGSPAYTTLSYNGVAYNDRNGHAYSTAWSLKDIQDMYDLTMFHRDNMIANSGVNGSRINLAGIPKVLGDDFTERMLKFIALRKQGIELIDPTEEGAELFNHYGDFKNSLDGSSIQAIQLVLESLEKQADIVSGVNRYMYQAAEQRDAVSNVKTGIKQTSLIVKDTFDLIYNIRENILSDLINQSKITYIKGKRGSYILGSRMVLFTLMPKDFCFTDYNINIINIGRDADKIEQVKAILPELVRRDDIAADTLITVALSDSATEIVKIIEDSIQEKKEEHDQIKHLTDQLNQVSSQAQQSQQELMKLQSEIKQYEALNLKLKEREVDIKAKQVDNNNDFNQENLALNKMIAIEKSKKDTQVLQLEREQLYAENAKGPSREIKNDI